MWVRMLLGNAKRGSFRLPFRTHVLLGASWRIEQRDLLVCQKKDDASASTSHDKQQHEAFYSRTDPRYSATTFPKAFAQVFF